MAQACNLARNGHDVQDSWESVASILVQYGDNEGDFASVAGPGYFNDPDMVIHAPNVMLGSYLGILVIVLACLLSLVCCG